MVSAPSLKLEGSENCGNAAVMRAAMNGDAMMDLRIYQVVDGCGTEEEVRSGLRKETLL